MQGSADVWVILLTGTFLCVTTTAQSFPRTATDVCPPWLMALKAYSECGQDFF